MKKKNSLSKLTQQNPKFENEEEKNNAKVMNL